MKEDKTVMKRYILVGFLGLLIMMLLGFTSCNNPTGYKKISESGSYMSSSGTLSKIIWDGHLWVIRDAIGDKGGIAHHPDCPCGK